MSFFIRAGVTLAILTSPRWWRRRLKDWTSRDRLRCPRRDEGFGWENRDPRADFWDASEWGWGPWRRFVYWWRNGPVGDLANRIRRWGWDYRSPSAFKMGWARQIGEMFNWSSGGERWEWPWQPRTCSYCGGVNVEDVIKLFNEGWEGHSTDKRYKWYVEPPGYLARYRWSMAPVKSGPPPPYTWSAVPPVKLYTQHFESQEQVDRLNEAMKKAPRA